MIPLAFNFDGESFEVPPTAAAWRVKRLRAGRGAPELVYSSEGLPLVVPLETDIEELRRLVIVPGKYRLDLVDEAHRLVKGADAAYVLVRAVDPVAPAIELATSDIGTNANAVLMEAMRQNSEIARSIVDRFPAMLEASAVLLRAADGAGLPARKPREDGGQEDDEGEEDGAQARRSGFDLNAVIAELVPVLVATIANGDIKLPSLMEMLDWRRAGRKSPANRGAATSPPPPSRKPPTDQPAQPTGKPSASAAPAAGPAAPAADPDAPAAAEDMPPLSPQAIAHFLAIQSALTPEEAALARAAAAELSPADLRAWFDQLSAMSVPEAVARVRALLASTSEAA
jgi:hypothetical protein